MKIATPFEMLLFGFMALLLIVLVVGPLIIVALKFAQIADDKGYPKGYFWWCLLLGPIGWLMVAALPDRIAQDTQLRILEALEGQPQAAPAAPVHTRPDGAQAPVTHSTWRCEECGTVNHAEHAACQQCGSPR